MTRSETIAFLRDHATLEDLREIREVFSLRLQHLQTEGAMAFRRDERVLFVEDGIEHAALVLKVSRRFVTVCLGNHRHVRCDVSYLKKLAQFPNSSESAHAEHASAAR